MAKKRTGYNHSDVARYWSRRLKETDPLAAVLTFDAPALINEAYHNWETDSLTVAIRGGSRSHRPLRGREALDIACGIGRITRRLAELGARTAAIDLSPAMIDAATRHCAGLGVNFICAAADNIPYESGRFDIITCFGLLEHLPSRQRAKCVAEIVRLLRQKGRAFIVVNNIDCIFLEQRGIGTVRQGYHVELVGLDWLSNAARINSAEICIHAANPGYAVAHYQIVEGAGRGSTVSRRQAEKIAAVMKLNAQIPAEGSLARRLASHFLVELSHKS